MAWCLGIWVTLISCLPSLSPICLLSGLLALGFCIKILYAFLVSSVCDISYLTHSPLSDDPNTVWWKVESIYSSLCNFLHVPYTSFLSLSLSLFLQENIVTGRKIGYTFWLEAVSLYSWPDFYCGRIEAVVMKLVIVKVTGGAWQGNFSDNETHNVDHRYRENWKYYNVC
jgi:hypothetical protein